MIHPCMGLYGGLFPRTENIIPVNPVCATFQTLYTFWCALHGEMYLAGNERLEVFVIIRLLPRFQQVYIPVREQSWNWDFFIKPFSRVTCVCIARAVYASCTGIKMRRVHAVMHMHERILQKERRRERIVD
jgi:hypothetical protein